MRRTNVQNNYNSKMDVKWPDGSSMKCENITKQNREYIRDLDTGVMKGFVAGIIIAKQDPKSFADRKDPNQMRWQLKFTIRDSMMDYINVCCWGGDTFINDISKLYKIGDIIKIENGLVQRKLNTENEEKYNPSTPSEFNLTLNETHALIQHCDDNDVRELNELAFLPAKDSNDYYTLADVIANGQNLHGTHINILAALRDAGTSRQFVSKTGKDMQRRELKIFDETCVSFPLVMWDNELSEMANTWNPQEVVLFLADVKVHFDDYKKCMIATCDGKTIITVNPDIPEAHQLYSYAQSIDLKDFAPTDDDGTVDVESIDDVFTIEDLEDKMNKSDTSSSSSPFYGILYACISHFDIDCHNEQTGIIAYKCSSCKRTVSNNQCNNVNCSLYNQYLTYNNNDAIIKHLDFRIALSDVTGGLPGFRMQGKTAEKLIGCNVNEFIAFAANKRTELKWKFLMERFKIFFKCTVAKGDNYKYLDIIQAMPCESTNMVF